MVMFSFFISFLDVKKFDDNNGIIICVLFSDCIFEKFFDIGLLIFKEGVFLSNNCFKIMVNVVLLDVKFNVRL